MRMLQQPGELRSALAELRHAKQRIGFVPTMGNLHAGHVSLMQAARRDCEFAVASIFVNPLQFGANEDLASYPRTPDEDHAKLREAGIDLLFEPTVETIYPVPMQEHTKVEVPGLADLLCGASRPGHFRGVTTVVAKLLNLVQPDVAYFGEKDYQQLAIIRRMCRDLCFPVEVIGLPTVREASGLAMSSRNAYLSAQERETAAELYRVLQWAAATLRQGTLSRTAIEQAAGDRLQGAGFNTEYFAIRSRDSLGIPGQGCEHLVILAAARLGKARLIDNIRVDL